MFNSAGGKSFMSTSYVTGQSDRPAKRPTRQAVMAAVASQRAKRRHFKTKRKAEDELRRQVDFNSDDNMEYHVPLDTYNQSPIPTLSTSSVSNDPRFLDEIALLKRGVITRDTPKHTYRRGLSAEDPNVGGIHDDKPITLAELNTRGLRIDNEHIIYGFPESSCAKANDGGTKPQSSGTSVLSEDSTRNTIRSFIISPKNVKEFSVGFPGENATLRISSLSRNGESYELSTGDDVCVLQQRPENVVLITWKN